MFARSSIRFRLTAWYSFTLATLLGLVAISSYFVMRASIYRAVDVDLRYRLSSVEDEMRELPANAPISELPGELHQLSTLDVLFQVYDEAGKFLYQSDQLAAHNISPTAPSASGSTIVYRDFSRGWPVRLAARPISFRGHRITLEVVQPLKFHYASLREFRTALLISLPLLVGLATLLGYWLSCRALAPVNHIVRDARSIDPNRPTQRLSVPPVHDELRSLAETLNAMLERIDVSLKRTKQFTADASHELRAPLTLIQAAAEYSLRRKRSNGELLDAMKKVLRESKRTSQLIDNLLLLARADSDQETLTPVPVCVSAALSEALERAAPLAADRQIQVASEIQDTAIAVKADPVLLQRLFFIIIDNAIKYTPERGSVTVDLHSIGQEVIINIGDTGIGISPEDLPHVFDRFWRADKVRSRTMGGTGLGLSIAKWIVETIGGTLRVESTLGQGSRFEVRLPAAQNGAGANVGTASDWNN